MEHQFDSRLLESLNKLKHYCEIEDFKGWDPYDGLNSKVFQITPLKNWRITRLAWIQLFKRSPMNLRPLLFVQKEYNSKGIGLFLTAYCNLNKATRLNQNSFGKKEIEKQINYLADLLLSLQSEGYSGSCWGYNFDWQSRAFYQPKYTPTVVATSFCAEALFNAFEVTKKEKYLESALSSARFIENDLNKIDSGENIFLSYSPLDKSKVYNASLLGARLLAHSYKYCGNENYLKLAAKIVNACIQAQDEDGSWLYGAAQNQKWIDSFHTGFNLECIWEYMFYTKDTSPQHAFEKGMNYYLNNFFLDDGTPKYYNNKTYPIDIHSPAQLLVTLSKVGQLNSNRDLTNKIINWTINNMQDPKGFFYYQIKKGISSKISYMRWAQSWMLYALSYYIIESNN